MKTPHSDNRTLYHTFIVLNILPFNKKTKKKLSYIDIPSSESHLCLQTAEPEMEAGAAIPKKDRKRFWEDVDTVQNRRIKDIKASRKNPGMT